MTKVKRPLLGKIYRSIHLLTTVAVAAVGLLGCQQNYVREDVFDLSCVTVNSAAAGHLTTDDVIVIGPLESSSVNLSYEEKLQFTRQIALALKATGYSNASADTRPLSNSGMAFYNAYLDAITHTQDLSPQIASDFKSQFATVKWLIVGSVKGVNENESDEQRMFNSNQSVNIHYKLWSLIDNRFVAEIGVEGFVHQGNERIKSDKRAVLPRVTENIFYFLLYNTYPDKDPLDTLLIHATRTFAKQLKTLPNVSSLKNSDLPPRCR
jgi:hypothetical protein